MDKSRQHFMFIIGFIVVLAAIGSTILLHYHSVPADNRDVLNQANGSLWTMAIMVVTWCFGSSKGSSDKDALLANSTPMSPNSVTKEVKVSTTETPPDIQSPKEIQKEP